MGLPSIDPPLLNSANPWATTELDLQALFDCPSTGAITTRTSLLNGFKHDDAIHQYAYFACNTLEVCSQSDVALGSLNTLGYSPIPLREYLESITRVVTNSPLTNDIKIRKSCIISVTGSVEEVTECYRLILRKQADLYNPLCMEVNLSCPNIPGKPPPAYSESSLLEYLQALGPVKGSVPIGLKTPPYTYHDQYRALINALLKHSSTIDFITSTNTLGSSLIIEADTPAISSASGTGIGGMAGPPLHPLALGNVKTIRDMLNKHDSLEHIDIVGVGGVYDSAGFDRMRSVGAKVVAVGTALGVQGINVFQRILS
ncbi:hypothetical protein AMS68_007966 [Peltaster fructicola]|uniref:Dihydroorotate dehydrogenase (fumarate) n=1 Tax=Peltaster fructicola TaxID=286661 RepID=A0A6H0Y6J5_9PEZI|nr:hypothetical protein AMS68_007966 [Peltaster fructicola]